MAETYAGGLVKTISYTTASGGSGSVTRTSEAWRTRLGLFGAWITTHIGPDVMRWILGVSFIGMGLWILVPDKLDDDDAPQATQAGVFFTTLVAFFLAEMGDKTQFATIALGAQYQGAVVAVVLGTTFGMMLANVPAVLFGEAITRKVPIRAVHVVAALLFAALGVLALVGG